MRYSVKEFESLAARALDSLPAWIHEHMQNVAVLIQDWPTAEQLRRVRVGPGRTLLGLYEGIPLIKRGRGYLLVPPDRIILFQGPLEQIAPDQAALEQAIRRTIIHEFAHHFGISDAHLDELVI